jgi:hypothetical protein
MAIATVQDVVDRWGQPADDAMTAAINKRLGDVERLIERRFRDEGVGTIAEQITANEFETEDVEQVESDAVLRIIRNMDGYLSENDGNYGYQVIQALASGKLEIPPEDWYTLGITDSDGFFVLVPNLAPGS